MTPSSEHAARLCLVLFVCVMVNWVDSSLAAGPSPYPEPSYQVDVQYVFGEKGLVLTISVTSLLDMPIYIDESSLPWECVHAIDLVAMIPEPAGAVLVRLSPIDDPVTIRRIFRPGETLHGVLLLREEFTDIDSLHCKSDILLFWSCQLRVYGGAPLARKGGWLLIPRHP